MRRFEFLDPAVVLERKQDGTCLGCVELVISRWSGARKYVCSKGHQRDSIEWIEMHRCKRYKTEEGTT